MSATQDVQIEAPHFQAAIDEGEVVAQDSYHQPGPSGPLDRTPDCGCKLTTRKGAYRDVTVEMPDGRVVHYYHQSPVVVEAGEHARLSSCGHHTKTTKERLNRHMPRGYRLRQRDFDWILSTPDGDELAFEDGMVVDR